MNPVKASAPPLDPAVVLAHVAEIAPKRGFRVEKFGEVGGHPLLALTKRTPGRRPKIYISTGIHGDEPAGPAALLKLLENGFFDSRATWFLCPLLNPLGLARGTRENPDGVDLNRDYREPRSSEIRAHIAWLERQPRFDLSLCLHEDWETSGFYIYELNPAKKPPLAEPIIRAVSDVCPIELAELIDGRPGKDGIIRPADEPTERPLWAEAIYLRVHHSDQSCTTESPSARPMEQRIAAQCAAVETAVKLVCGT